MRSSTSSSSPLARSPHHSWLKVWGLAVILFTIGVGTVEGFWRRQGFQPSVIESDWGLWAVQRSKLRPGDPRSVALLGLSRMAHDFSLPAFKERFPDYRIAQLAVNGESPIATLKHLADDERFVGIVLCDLTATEFPQEHWPDQQPNVDHYQRTLSVEYPEIVLKAFWQSHFTLINPRLNLKEIIVSVTRDKKLPDSGTRVTITRTDRSRAFDRTRVSDPAGLKAQQAEQHDQRLIERMASYGDRNWLPQWRQDVAAIRTDIEKLQRRGGRVVFVRLPTQGPYWRNEERLTPRALYWDQIAALTSATTIHFQDLDLPPFDLPDLSHLEYRDAAAFTHLLLDELVRLGVLQE